MGCGASTAAPDKPVEEKTVDTKPVEEKPTATPTETAAAPATPAPSTGAQAPTHGPVGMVLSKAFAAFDVNGNGTLDKMELKRAFRAIGISKVDVEALWGEFDFDGDGAISLAEFDANLKDKTRKMLEERFEAGFVFDADEWAKGAKGEAAVEPTAEEPVAAAEPVAAVEEGTKTDMGMRYNTLRASPADATFKLAVVQFKVDGVTNGGSDKGPDGNRVDSIPIANSVIKAGGACDLILYDATKNVTDTAEFESLTAKYDALIVRINPGQLSQGTSEGTQMRFDELMNKYIAAGKLVWSSPKIQTQMGAKDALVKIGSLNCGLEDTFAYYEEKDLVEGFKKTCAFQPRVIKQNRGSAGEGIWLCWLWDKESDTKIEIYPSKTFGEVSLGDDDYLKLMEMNDNHVEYHTVKEFMAFCVGGPDSEGAGTWTSTFPGKYLEGGKEAGGQLVDQRLLPRIDEGEVRILMAGDTCQMAIHKKPMGGGLSAVGGNSEYTYYTPDDPKYKGLIEKLNEDIPTLLPKLDLAGEPLPLLWTCDYIPKNPDDWDLGPYDRSCPDEKTEYTVGEFNCSCVGISKFQAVCGGDKTLADVSDEDYFDACQLTDLMGVKAIEMLEKAKK